MRAYRNIRNTQGFSLIEWMVVILLGLFITAGMMAVFSDGQRNISEKRAIAALEENGRLAMHFIGQDLRQVGFWGDYTGNVLGSPTSLRVPAGISSDCSNLVHSSFPHDLTGYTDIYGFTYDSNLSSEMSCLAEAVSSGNLVVGSDVLSLTRAHGDPMAVNTTFDATRYYLETNFGSAQIFAGADSAGRPSVNNGMLWQYIRHIYFVDEALDTGIPRLRRWNLEVGKINKTTEPLVEGVEHLRILYMVDDDDDGVGEQLLSANNVTPDQWVNQKVVGAQVHILVRALEADQSYNNNGSYQLGDLTITVNDSFRRLLLSQTISMRNSLLYQMEKS